MQRTIQEILETLCTEASVLASNDFQDIFLLSDARQARMAYDVLSVHGFEVKLYDEHDKCRLYYTRPKASDASIRQQLESAFHYASALSKLRLAIHDLCMATDADYTINIMNSPENRRQISIAISKIAALIEKPAVAQALSASAKADSRSITSQPPRRVQRSKTEDISDIGAPALAKKHLMQNGPNKGKEKDATWRWLYTHVFRHLFSSGAGIISFIILILGLISIGILMKGFVCPDFASDKSKARWYCSKEGIQRVLNPDKAPAAH